MRTWRQTYPRLIFIEAEIVPSPSTNHGHVGIPQYNVVGLFATIPRSPATVTAGWLLHIASQVTGTALVAGSGQLLGSSALSAISGIY